MRRMTKSEAYELIESAWYVSPDSSENWEIEVTLGDMDVDQVLADIASFFAYISGTIDPDSYSITADHVEGSSIPATTLLIKVQS